MLWQDLPNHGIRNRTAWGFTQSLEIGIPKGGRFTADEESLFAGQLRALTELSGVQGCVAGLLRGSPCDGPARGAHPVGLLPARPGAVTRVGATVERRPAQTTPQIRGRHAPNVTVSRNGWPGVSVGIADRKCHANNGVAFGLAGCGCSCRFKTRREDEPRRVTKGVAPVAGKTFAQPGERKLVGSPHCHYDGLLSLSSCSFFRRYQATHDPTLGRRFAH